jgi:hypothetical protein
MILLGLTAALVPTAYSCLYWNTTIEDNKLTAWIWDDANNNNRTNPEDTICQAHAITPYANNYWRIPCDHTDILLEAFLDSSNSRFIDFIYQYSNPNAAALQTGDPDFSFTWRGASRDGHFFKGREFCAQYDILALVKPEALKNPCDSDPSC